MKLGHSPGARQRWPHSEGREEARKGLSLVGGPRCIVLGTHSIGESKQTSGRRAFQQDAERCGTLTPRAWNAEGTAEPGGVHQRLDSLQHRRPQNTLDPVVQALRGWEGNGP